MPSLQNRKRPDGHIVKPEDKIWKEQFDKLTKEDHKEKLHMLGLDEEETEELVEDFEEVKKGKKGKVLQEWEEEVAETPKEEKKAEEKEE